MNSSIITEQAFQSLESYFNHLTMTGYMSYGEVHNLLGFLLADMFINSEFRAFITEEDYGIIGRFLYCISGDCLIPYPQFLNEPAKIGTILPKNSGESPFRISEESSLRYAESSEARISEYRTKYWNQD